MRRWPFRLLLGAALVLPLGLAMCAWLAVADAPTVPLAAPPTAADIARATALIQRNDPRHALPGITRAVLLSAHELELLLSQGARRLGNEPRAQVALSRGAATVHTSLRLPANPLGRWLNVQAQLRQTNGPPAVDSLQVGRLPVPGWLAEAALPLALRAMGLHSQGALAHQVISQVSFAQHQVAIAYAWPDNAQQQIADTLLPPAEQDRVKVYAEQAASLTQALRNELGARTPVPLVRLLQPMFALAQQRSARNQAPALENRAALLVLACLVNGKSVASLVPSARQWARPRTLTITLAGRVDFPQHYLVSAVLAAEGGGALSDAVGLYKEVADAQGGSGFSFNDIAADRAGTRFGLRALRSPAQLQARLAAGVQDEDLLPPITDLPEFMQLPEFQQRFGGVGSPAYRRMMADIESRLDSVPLLAR